MNQAGFSSGISLVLIFVLCFLFVLEVLVLSGVAFSWRSNTCVVCFGRLPERSLGENLSISIDISISHHFLREF